MMYSNDFLQSGFDYDHFSHHCEKKITGTTNISDGSLLFKLRQFDREQAYITSGP